MRRSLAAIVTLLIVLSFVHYRVNAEERSVTAFVRRLYEVAMNRECDGEGLKFWSDSLLNDEKSGGEVAKSFFLSDEFKSFDLPDDEYVSRLYKTFMDRIPDDSGMAFWCESLKNGTMSREHVFESFIDSDEWTDICTGAGIRTGGLRDYTSFVLPCYRHCFARTPNNTELYFWAGVLRDGQMSGRDVVKAFFDSEEFKGLNCDNRTFIEKLYPLVLDREGDLEGISFWLSNLENGMTRDALFESFAASSEFDALCRAHGIFSGIAKIPSPTPTPISDLDRIASEQGLICIELKDVIGYIDENGEFVPDVSRGHEDGENGQYSPETGGYIFPIVLDKNACYGTVRIYGKYLEEIDNEFMKLVSEHRASLGKSSLNISTEQCLIDYCRLRAAECSLHFSHKRVNGQTFSIFTEGFQLGLSIGENISQLDEYNSNISVSANLLLDKYISSNNHHIAMIDNSFVMHYSSTFERYEWNGHSFVPVGAYEVHHLYEPIS